MVVLTFELVVQKLEGEALRRWNGSGRPGIIPMLAFRFMDLAPILLEATTVDGQIDFRKGKALVFDLPEELHVTQLPLWILLLLPEPEQKTADRCATLLASTCLDLRHEVAEAMHRHSDTMSFQTVPFFRRCSFGMTSVAEEQSLQLTCFLRLYCGRYQPITGGELLLEPIAWPHDHEGDVALPKTSSPTPAVTVETQTEDVEEKPPRRSGGKGEEIRQRSLRSHDMVTGAAGAIFPKEIELTGTEAGYDVYSSPLEVIEDLDPPAPPPSVVASCPSALPLVSELVKELMQIPSPA